MAARRLLIIMLLLLAISTLAAALVPPPEEQDGETEPTTTAPPTRTGPVGGGKLVKAEISASLRSRPERIEVSVGDQLALTVSSSRPGEIAVPDFGLLDWAEPGAPARFDILVGRKGRFEVTAEGRGEVARIVASERERKASPEARPGGPRR